MAGINRASDCAWSGVGGEACLQVRRAGFGGGDRPPGVIHLRQDGGIQSAQGWSGFPRPRRVWIDGCRESEVSLRVIDRRYGLMALEWGQSPDGARAGGMQRERAAGSLAKRVLYYKTHLAFVRKRGALGLIWPVLLAFVEAENAFYGPAGTVIKPSPNCHTIVIDT